MQFSCPQGPVAINDARIQDAVGNIRFYSITFRLFKLPGLMEPAGEDYGHLAIYKVRPTKTDGKSPPQPSVYFCSKTEC